ncbi:hypothetical protein KEM52_002301, partial [Ascosphaera acerosa]
MEDIEGPAGWKSASPSTIDSEEAEAMAAREMNILNFTKFQISRMEEGGLRDAWEAIAVLAHAVAAKRGLELVSVTDDFVISESPCRPRAAAVRRPADPRLPHCAGEPAVLQVLPEGWSNDKEFTFSYIQPDAATSDRGSTNSDRPDPGATPVAHSTHYVLRVRRDEQVARLEFSEKHTPRPRCEETVRTAAAELPVQRFVNAEMLPLAHAEVLVRGTLAAVFARGRERIDSLAREVDRVLDEVLRPATAAGATAEPAKATAEPAAAGGPQVRDVDMTRDEPPEFASAATAAATAAAAAQEPPGAE